MKSTLALARTFPPSESCGWTIHFIERKTRYWVDARAGVKNLTLFEQGTLDLLRNSAQSAFSKAASLLPLLSRYQIKVPESCRREDGVVIKVLFAIAIDLGGNPIAF